MSVAPVITIDGPSGSGKGTIAQLLASQLGWHYLDSGALYRTAAWWVLHQKVDISDEASLSNALDQLKIYFKPQAGGVKVYCDTFEVTTMIRDESVGVMASKISSISLVRKALLNLQLGFRQDPGLVTDGRDMGTVVFRDAVCKFFLKASTKERASRRYLQLQQRGINGNLAQIEADLISRDARDRDRSISPTKPADDAITIDTSGMPVDAVMVEVNKALQQRFD